MSISVEEKKRQRRLRRFWKEISHVKRLRKNYNYDNSGYVLPKQAEIKWWQKIFLKLKSILGKS